MAKTSPLGERVKQARQLGNVSQKQLTRSAELGAGHLSHIEAGNRRRLRAATFDAIARALALHGVRVSTEWLRTGEGKPPRAA